MAGAQRYRDEGCDVIVAIGGGSVIDCASGHRHRLANGGHILDYEGVDRIPALAPPLICIPDRRDAADISQFAIINNNTDRHLQDRHHQSGEVPGRGRYRSGNDDDDAPYLTACTGLDAADVRDRGHAPTASSPVVDVHALAAIRLSTRTSGERHRRPAACRLKGARTWRWLSACRPDWPSNASLARCMRWRNSPAATSTCRTARATPAARSRDPLQLQRCQRTLPAYRRHLGVPGGDERDGRGHCGTTPALRHRRRLVALRRHTHGTIDELAPHAERDARLFNRAGPARRPSRRSALKPSLTKRRRLPGREERDRIIGLGERSFKKSYYPELRSNLSRPRALSHATSTSRANWSSCFTPDGDRRREHARRSCFRSAGSQPDRFARCCSA